MSEKKLFRVYLLEIWISIFVFCMKIRRNNIKLKSHNGVCFYDYPETNWNMVPFPAQKGAVFNADNLATVNRHDFLQASEFIHAKNTAERRWGEPNQVRDISWRLHVMLWAFGLALRNQKANDSIFVECGTGRGYMAAGIADYYQLNEKSPFLYLIDTFSSQLILTSGNAVISPAHFAYSDGDGEVREYFSQYANVRVVKGLIPDAFKQLPDSPICFLHVDLNNAVAEEATLKHLESRLISGAVIVFDDYGGPGGQEQALVHEQFAKSANRNLLVLPTGQAVIIW